MIMIGSHLIVAEISIQYLHNGESWLELRFIIVTKTKKMFCNNDKDGKHGTGTFRFLKV